MFKKESLRNVLSISKTGNKNDNENPEKILNSAGFVFKPIITLFCLFSVLILSAQKEQVLDSVVVEGKTVSRPFSRTTQNVQIITKDEISRSPATSIEELLTYYTGVDIRQLGVHGVQADISIRGSSFEQVLVLVNGVRMNDSQTGHHTMNILFDLASVERIEIIKGPSARRFGQNAYAGAVNIITRPSKDTSVAVSALGGDYSTYSLGAGVTVAGERFSQFFQAETSQSDGYRYNTDYQIKNAWYQNRYELNGGKIQFQAGIIDKKFGANGFYSSPLARDQYEQIQTSLVSLGWDQSFGRLKVNANAYWRRAQDEYIFVRSNPSIYRNLHIGNNAGLEVNSSYTSRLGVTGLGVDFREEYLSSNNLGNHDRFVSFVFLEHHFSFFEKSLEVVPGISFADYSDFGGFWYPGVDVSYRIDSKSRLLANVGKTYRIPSYTDLYYSDPLNEGNPDLKPENALSYEIGYRFTHRNIRATLSLFRRESKDLIDWTKERVVDKWKPENIARVNTNGIEVGFQQRFFSSFIKSYNIGYTYLDNDLKNSHVNYSRFSLDNLKHQLVVKLEHKLFKNFTNQIIYRYNDRVSLEDYQLVDDRLTYELKDFSIFMQVTNIFNTRYTETNLVPMPGRWLQFGATFRNVFD